MQRLENMNSKILSLFTNDTIYDCVITDSYDAATGDIVIELYVFVFTLIVILWSQLSKSDFITSGVARDFFSSGSKILGIGTEVLQLGPETKPSEADDFMIIMYRILTTR